MIIKINYIGFNDRNILRELSEKYNVPGFTFTIIKNGIAESTKAYGIKDTSTGEEMTADTIFEAASLTKTVFSLMVLRAVDKNLMSLDSRLSDLAPDIRISDDPRRMQCTVRNALSHGTGIVGWGDRPHLIFENDPGTAFAYSGEGYYWLQHVMEHVSGLDFCDNMNCEILGPLNMEDSYPVMCSQVLEKESHKFDENGNMQTFRTWVDKEGVPEPNSAWSLYSTAIDYSRFMLEIMNEHGHLKEDTFRAMTSVQNIADDDTAWGLGWGIVRKDPDVIWHWGDNGCYRSFTAMDLKTKDGVCIFCNAKRGGELCMEFMKILTGEKYWNKVEEFIKNAE